MCTRFYPALGGGETYTWLTAKFLVSRGHQVTVWTSDLYSFLPWTRLSPPHETIDGIEIVRMRGVSLPLRRFRGYLIIPGQTLAWASQSPHFDVAHLQAYGNYSSYGQLPQWYARRFRMVLSTITLPNEGMFRRVYDTLIGRKLLHAAHHIVSLTTTEKQYLMQLGCPESKISVIPPGPAIDLESCTSVEGDLSRWQMDRDSNYVMSFGRLARNKGLSKLLAATAPLLKKDRSLRLVFAGEDHGALTELTEQSRELRVQDQVLFTGRLTDAEAVQLISHCSVFVFPSERNEAYGMTLLTAMQLGRPVVATELPGAIDLVTPGESGLRVRPGDTPGMEEAIQRLLSNRELGRAMGDEARRRTEHITWRAVADRVSEVLERAASD